MVLVKYQLVFAAGCHLISDVVSRLSLVMHWPNVGRIVAAGRMPA